jgi:predicted amidohydrolase
MPTLRIALANLRFPTDPRASVMQAVDAIAQASAAGVELICFPECFVPGYRGLGRVIPPPSSDFLEHAWRSIADAAKTSRVAVILGTERIVDGRLAITALIIDDSGSRLGFQDKVQLDPCEDETFAPGSDRRVFRAGALTFGVVICHEGWRYPETVRWAARRGAHIVFQPQFLPAQPGAHRPTTFADPRGTFHEKAVLCRAAENTCYFASVNYAEAGAPATSAIARPDGTLLAHQPYGEDGLLIADIDTDEATRLLALRYKAPSPGHERDSPVR